jgi:hypothetical protein
LQELKNIKEASTSKSAQDKEIQVELANSTSVQEEEEEEEEDEDVFVYPSEDVKESIPEPIKEEEEEDEDEDEEETVFVYRGKDAVTTITEDESNTKQYNERDLQQREATLKSYYEPQISNLTEKVQMTDSKALRFAKLYKSLKDKVIEDDKENDKQKKEMHMEIDRLNKEVTKVQDLLTTTETNYRNQVDAMTEFISQLQEEIEQLKQKQDHSTARRSQNYSNQR